MFAPLQALSNLPFLWPHKLNMPPCPEGKLGESDLISLAMLSRYLR